MKRSVENLTGSSAKKPRLTFEDKFFNVLTIQGKPNIEELVYLLENGTNPNCVDEYGHTPLCRAIKHFFRECIDARFTLRCNRSDYLLAITLLLIYGADDSITYEDVGTCRIIFTKHFLLREYKIYDRVEVLKNVLKQSKVVEDLEYLLCASQCESEDTSFFREYRESVLDDEMVFVNNIIPMLIQMQII